MATTYITYAIETLTGRGLPTTVDADGYDTYLAASEMAAAEHDGEYRITQPCAYCDRAVEAHRDDSVAAVDDDAAWAALAKDHAADCEWIATRAHRRSGNEENKRTVVKSERGQAQCATCGDLATRTPVYIDDRAESREADEACARCGSHDVAHWLPEAE